MAITETDAAEARIEAIFRKLRFDENGLTGSLQNTAFLGVLSEVLYGLEDAYQLMAKIAVLIPLDEAMLSAVFAELKNKKETPTVEAKTVTVEAQKVRPEIAFAFVFNNFEKTFQRRQEMIMVLAQLTQEELLAVVKQNTFVLELSEGDGLRKKQAILDEVREIRTEMTLSRGSLVKVTLKHLQAGDRPVDDLYSVLVGPENTVDKIRADAKSLNIEEKEIERIIKEVLRRRGEPQKKSSSFG